jgi:hypothetical protein
MSDHDTLDHAKAQQVIARYSDHELLAIWEATETVDEVDTVSVREAAFIALAAQELARRDLLPA